MNLPEFIELLERNNLNPAKNGEGYKALCPAHIDNKPSLAINNGDKGIIVKCFAGCNTNDICDRLGIKINALFREERERKNSKEYSPINVDVTYDYTDE